MCPESSASVLLHGTTETETVVALYSQNYHLALLTAQIIWHLIKAATLSLFKHKD